MKHPKFKAAEDAILAYIGDTDIPAEEAMEGLDELGALIDGHLTAMQRESGD